MFDEPIRKRIKVFGNIFDLCMLGLKKEYQSYKSWHQFIFKSVLSHIPSMSKATVYAIFGLNGGDE